ncbi:MAG: protein kinase, partial [Merismopediaceae bacterium]|nr:protein kinase [Merismopediaceae bacterium]
MSLCINPDCDRAKNEVDQGQQLFCSSCGSKLLLNDTYRVLRYLGVGGFAWTALVDDGGSLKVLKVLHNKDPKAIALFDQEADVLQKLHHAGIPKVEALGRFDYYAKGSDKPLRCLVMEYIEGENLEDYLTKNDYRPITEQVAIRWLRELVEILDLVHKANYFHRDIKPANIMIRTTGKLALIDFGTAREETATYLQNQQGKRGTV